MNIETIRKPVASELESVETLLLEQMDSDLSLVTELSQHIIGSGGKRIRPLLLLLSSRCFDYQGDDHIKLAAVVEFVHTATLLHDDVVDASMLRRGQPTANAIWGNQASVLIGDFLYSRAFQMMVKIKNLNVLNAIATATNVISRGEVLQLMYAKNTKISIEQYMEVIQGKTAALFAVSSEIGAQLGQASQEDIQIMKHFGQQLGVVFQLVDDILDYKGSSEHIGKNIGDDLAEGKLTLPLIHALHHGTNSQQKMIAECVTTGNLEYLDDIQDVIHETQAIEQTYEIAEHAKQSAITFLTQIKPSIYQEHLIALTDFAFSRLH